MLLNIIITVIVIIVTSMLLLGLLSGYIVNDRSRTLTEEADRVNQMTVFYINNRNDAVEDFYKMSLRNVSNRIRGIIYIVDRRGNVISSDNASETVNMSKIDADFAQKVLSGKKTVEVGNLDGLYNHTFLTVGVPLAFGDEIVGATYLAMPMPEINRYKYHIFRITISAITTAIIVAMVISYIYSRKASKPIMDLNNAAKAVANGNFDVKVSTDGDSEMAELSSNFNAMVESLKSLEDMRSSFIANVSHELRTPMTTISGFVEGIMDGTIPPEKRDTYLKIVLDETKRLARLVTELLQLARIDAGTMQLNIREFDINELIRITILKFESRINEKALDIDIDFENENEPVLADKDTVQRVVTNLFDNAIKFNYQNGYIKIAVKRHNGKIEISIENSGIGIEPDELLHIWERFYKTDKSRSYDKKGMGLGLYLVQGIIAAHDEKIWVESEKNKWARFTFTLKKA